VQRVCKDQRLGLRMSDIRRHEEVERVRIGRMHRDKGVVGMKRTLPATLDAEQKKVVKAVTAQVHAAALNTDAIDRAACRAVIEKAYAAMGLPAPTVRFFDSPQASMRHLRELASGGMGEPAPLAADFSQFTGDMDELQGLLASMASVQPRGLAEWGEEVELPAGDLEREVIQPFTWEAGWEGLAGAVDKELGRLIHFEHAVTEALEASLQDGRQEWLLYSGGAAHLWGGAEALGRAQALVALGMLDAEPPALALGGEVLRSCGWVNAFEKLCLVSERPASLSLQGHARDRQGLQAHVTWRDGESSTYTYRD